MKDISAQTNGNPGTFLADFAAGFAGYYLTSLIVVLGVFFSVDFFAKEGAAATPLLSCFRFDAIHYLEIIKDGYSYDPAERSTVAFFPAYPMLAQAVTVATALTPEQAALLTSQIALLLSFVILARWVSERWPLATPSQRGVVLAIFGLWPTGVFFRMPYAESLFLCACLTALYGMARSWSPVVLAVIAGFATAVRPVGVAVSVGVLWHIVTRSGCRLRTSAIRTLLLGPLASWGLIAYMSYQWLMFENPWAFAQTQEHWTFHAPVDRSWQSKLQALASLEPLWGAYVPGHPRYWNRDFMPGLTPANAVFSLFFWNPILFLLAAILLALGGWNRWLTGSELALGTALLAIPYLTRSFEMSMASHGRFAAVVVVNYLVAGRLLTRAPPLLIAAVCAVLAVFLLVFTSLYAAGQPVF